MENTKSIVGIFSRFSEGSSIQVSANPEVVVTEESIRNIFSKAFAFEKKLGRPSPYLSNLLWKVFPGQVLDGFESFFSKSHQLSSDSTSCKIIKARSELGGRVYTYLEALCLSSELILSCKTGIKESENIVFFLHNNKLHYISTYRCSSDGGLMITYKRCCKKNTFKENVTFW